MGFEMIAGKLLGLFEGKRFVFFELFLCLIDLVIVLVDIQLELHKSEELAKCFKRKLHEIHKSAILDVQKNIEGKVNFAFE